MKPEYKFSEIAKAIGGKPLGKSRKDHGVKELVTDSRKVLHAPQSLFFALSGQKLDGHNYIEELYGRGVRAFVVTKEVATEKLPEAQFLLVNDAIQALQKLAGFHRKKFSFPVIAITGSNGKTVIKEWLYQLLHEDFNIVRSPKSFNSQIGVPLSLWNMSSENTLGIFEAGISEADEMIKLEKIVRPDIGIFTNIGEAHSEGFLNTRHKVKEKLKLFVNCKTLIYCKDYPDITNSIAEINALSKGADATDDKIKSLSWSMNGDADVHVQSVFNKNNHSFISLLHKGRELNFEIPFSDKASVENAIHCACLMIYLDIDFGVIAQRMNHLARVAMRLDMRDAINNCSLINDTYNSDIGSLKIAIDFLRQQNQHPKKTIILSDILQSGRGEMDLYEEVTAIIKQNEIPRFIGIGASLMRQRKVFEKIEVLELDFYESTEDFIRQMDLASFSNEAILLKGARKFRFEIIARLLEKKAHETVLEINLNAIAHNLKTYQSLLKPETKIMAMVKAFSYGSGSFEIANVLQFNHCDYLAVAYADEGIELRKNGITLPIMVMNPELRSFEAMIQHQLEPEIYSLSLLEKFFDILFLMRRPDDPPYPIHIELETGMNRLGFLEHDLGLLIHQIENNPRVKIASVFSHLAASEDRALDDFTHQQIEKFKKLSAKLCGAFDYRILRHILNSSGIARHTNAQFDMVRLGIGLYGIDSTEKVGSKLMNVSTLKTTISQVKQVKKGDSVGYGRVGKVSKDKTIATVGIGYADGLSRRLSNKTGRMLVSGYLVPIIGNVCMDMTMLDITGVDAHEGDEVIVFGENPTVEEVAEAAETIPYEILTGISGRVKRIYFQE